MIDTNFDKSLSEKPNSDNTERPPGDWQAPEPPIQEPDPNEEPLEAPTDEPTEDAGSIQV